MTTTPYLLTMNDRNAKITGILAKLGEPTDDTGLSFLCWLTEDKVSDLHARYGEVLTVQPLDVADTGSGTEPMESYTIRLTKAMEAYAVRLGDNNRSQGILRALAFAKGQGFKATKAKSTPK